MDYEILSGSQPDQTPEKTLENVPEKPDFSDLSDYFHVEIGEDNQAVFVDGEADLDKLKESLLRAAVWFQKNPTLKAEKGAFIEKVSMILGISVQALTSDLEQEVKRFGETQSDGFVLSQTPVTHETAGRLVSDELDDGGEDQVEDDFTIL